MNLRDLNSRYQTKETLISFSIGASKQIAGVNASRWSIAFALSSGGAGTFKISNENNVLGQGVPIPGSGSMLVYTARDFPGYVGGNFYAVQVTAGSQVLVIETFEIESETSEGV